MSNSERLLTRSGLVFVALLMIGITGCDEQLPPSVHRAITNTVRVLTGREARGTKSGAGPGAGASTGAGSMTPEQRVVRAQAELLAEVLRVVLMGEPRNVREFNNILSTLQQGASIEGLYNGFTRSSGYRSLEQRSGPAPKKAVEVFAQELAALEAALPSPTVFDAEAARPLPVFNPGEEDPKAAPSPAPSARPSPRRSTGARTADEYAKFFSGASIFTLKRVLSDEAMKVITSKQSSPDLLAQWYANWAVRLAARHVDFGRPERNLADPEFHRKWALAMSRTRPDSFLWEVLNRVHRVLNDANRTAETR